MADEKKIEDVFDDYSKRLAKSVINDEFYASNPSITPNNYSKLKCQGSYNCFKKTDQITPYCKFKSDAVSCIEANLTVNGKKINIKACDGYYSDIEVCLMYGETAIGKKFRSHWGLICKQQGTWRLNGDSRKCILFHHMGGGVEIAVGCIACCRERVMNAYGKYNVPKPTLQCFDYGRSSAAVFRFLGDKSLGRNVGYKYNNKYKHGEVYFEWCQTNCFRLVFDLLFYLKLDYDHAVKFTNTWTGLDGWDEVVETIREKYKDFFGRIFLCWMFIKSKPELKKVEKLVDGQYKLDAALGHFILPLIALGEALKGGCTIL